MSGDCPFDLPKAYTNSRVWPSPLSCSVTEDIWKWGGHYVERLFLIKSRAYNFLHSPTWKIVNVTNPQTFYITRGQPSLLVNKSAVLMQNKTDQWEASSWNAKLFCHWLNPHKQNWPMKAMDTKCHLCCHWLKAFFLVHSRADQWEALAQTVISVAIGQQFVCLQTLQQCFKCILAY